jgi:hypothetical protein
VKRYAQRKERIEQLLGDLGFCQPYFGINYAGANSEIIL